MPTAVNSQITDSTTQAAPAGLNPQVTGAVTQANVKVLAEAPAVAMGSIYQSLAHATGILFENAVSAQQQQNTLAQAAATQGVMQIYSLDTAAAGGAGAAKLAESSQEAVAGLGKVAALNPQITEAVQFTLDSNLLHSGDVAYGARAAADALGAAIERLNRASHEAQLHLIRQAAIAACLAGMVRDPDKADAYAAVLETLKTLA